MILQDAVMAVLVLDSSMTGSSLLGWSNALHTHFPEDPDAEYVVTERQVLLGLGLHDLLHQGHDDGEQSHQVHMDEGDDEGDWTSR